MTLLLLIALCLAIVLVSFLACGLFLWVTCIWLKIGPVSYPRACANTLWVSLVGNVVMLPVWWLSKYGLLIDVFFSLASIAVAIALLHRLLDASWGKTALAWLLVQVMSIAYAVVMVLFLQAAVAEAFVVPTGAMADGILGYHKNVTCPSCGCPFLVNCSSEAAPSEPGMSVRVEHAICPSCFRQIDFRRDGLDPPCETGDRVLTVRRFADRSPQRFDLCTFVFPPYEKDDRRFIYVKRLAGLPGETVALYYGDLYATSDLKYQTRERPKMPDEARDRQAMYDDDPEAHDVFLQQVKGRFEKKIDGKGYEILRKSPDVMLALRRLVHDNDYPARDLGDVLPPRWMADRHSRWTPDNLREPRRFTSAAGDDLSWLGYRHIVRWTRPQEDHRVPHPWFKISDQTIQALRADGVPDTVLSKLEPLRNRPRTDEEYLGELRRELPAEEVDKYKTRLMGHAIVPSLITSFMSYNSGRPHALPGENWVGDLLIECDVTVDQADGELVLELGKGASRLQARWELSTGTCTLIRLGKEHEQELASASTVVRKAGTYRLRFANFDERLTVWVDDKLPFGDGISYLADRERGPDENDLVPVRIGAKAANLSVGHLQIWRDTYYTLATTAPNNSDAPGWQWNHDSDGWRDPSQWEPLRSLDVRTMYVQPGHYLFLGDNSSESSDSRTWGLVPERLLLGRVLLRYFPFSRAGPVR